MVWQPVPELSLYASYTENFTGIVGDTAFPGVPLPPETAQQWKVGLKTEWLEQRFLGTLAWFELTKQNVAFADPDHPNFSVAIGEARTAGQELR